MNPGIKNMNRSLKSFTVLLLCGILMAGCDRNDSQKNYREYIDGGKINFSLTGKSLGYNINTNQSYDLFSNFSESYIDSYNQHVEVTRYSNDLQSNVQISIQLDTVNNRIIKSDSYIYYDIIYVAADKTILGLGGSSRNDTSTFSNFSYNPETGIMSANFKFLDQILTDSIVMSGNFKVTIYNFKFY